MSSIRICLIDDDHVFAEPFAELLAAYGFDVFYSADLAGAKTFIQEKQPDIVILDLYFEDQKSLDLLAQLRQHTPFGLIQITGSDLETDRFAALENGADAYLTKPVKAREIVAIINSLCDRLRGSSKPASSWLLDETLLVLKSPDQVDIKLTTSEFETIKLMSLRFNEPISREELLQNVGKSTESVQDRTVDILIHRLRQKAPGLSIQAVRHVGYKLVSPVKYKQL